VYAVGDRIVVFDWLIQRDQPPESRRAYSLRTGRFRPAPGLPAVQKFGRGYSGHQTHANGKVTLANGSGVLIWDGNGYELKRGRFQQTWQLSAKTSMGLGAWTAVPWGEDGFFYLSEWKVRYARRGARPVAVMPDAGGVMSLSPGPEHSIIASLGRDRRGHAARVWFPEDGSYIPITRKELGLAPHFSPHEMYWSATTRHVYIKMGHLYTFPDSDLLALKRVRPRGAGHKLPPT
jgi:hypothetical protein